VHYTTQKVFRVLKHFLESENFLVKDGCSEHGWGKYFWNGSGGFKSDSMMVIDYAGRSDAYQGNLGAYLEENGQFSLTPDSS